VEYYTSTQDIDNIVQRYGISHLYIIKEGRWDGLLSTRCKNLIHCVFTTCHPHGDVYSVISDDVNRICHSHFPVVHHMIRYNESSTVRDSLRKELTIPEDAIVFGRYGGPESFDIEFVHDTLRHIVNERNDIYFLFMNTHIFFQHPQIIYLDGTSCQVKKQQFIFTCDALLHGRSRGETFGLTCGEFAIHRKPIFSYAHSPEKNHLSILQHQVLLYHDTESLFQQLTSFVKDDTTWTKFMENNGYFQYLPLAVMKQFHRVYFGSEWSDS